LNKIIYMKFFNKKLISIFTIIFIFLISIVFANENIFITGGPDQISFEIIDSGTDQKLKLIEEPVVGLIKTILLNDVNNEPIILTIVVTDIEDTPIITSNGGGEVANINTNENQINITTITATDNDTPIQNLTFTITGGIDQNKFNITTEGILTFINPQDYENPTDTNTDNIYEVNITVIDDGTPNLTDTQNILVTVLDVFENTPPIITSHGIQGVIYLLNINENITGIITTVIAIDTDIPSQDLIYSLNSTDSSLFSIDSETGEVSFTTSPDYENPTDNNLDNVYEVEMIVTDSYGLTDYREMEVIVLDVEENQTPTNIEISNDTIVENLTQGSIVGTLTTTDTDEGDSHIYSLVIGEGYEDNERFTILENTDILKTNFTPDYELPIDQGDTVGNNTYTVRIQTDDGNGGTYQESFVILVTDTNENPTITSSENDISIVENTIENLITVTATDIDLPSQTLTYSVSGTDSSFFTINPTTGVLIFTNSPDYELPLDSNSDNIYNVTVIVTDDGTGNLTDSQILNVIVTNVSEGSSGKRTIKSTKKVCKDPKASNYEKEGMHTKALCKYGPTVSIDDPENPEKWEDYGKEKIRVIQREALRSLIKMLIERLNEMIQNIINKQQN